MAKMFYTAEETRQLLGKEEEELKQLTREGKLREFRDGPRVMYKADQVDQLRQEMGMGSDEVDLGPSDTGGVLGLADTGPEPSGSVISLADTSSKEDTATDMGISPTGSGTGISVLGLEDAGADPSAQTAVGGRGGSAAGDLGGSGLLDLSHQHDDTSFGQPVLEEVQGVQREAAGMAAGAAGAAGVAGRAPIYVEAPDALAPAIGGAALAATILVILALVSVAGSVGGADPLLKFVAGGARSSGMPWFYLLGGGVGLAVIFFVVGLIFGRKR